MLRREITPYETSPFDLWKGNEAQIRDIKRELIGLGLYNGSPEDMNDKIAFWEALRLFKERMLNIRNDATLDKSTREVIYYAISRAVLGDAASSVMGDAPPEETDGDNQDRADQLVMTSDDNNDLGLESGQPALSGLNVGPFRELSMLVRQEEEKKKHRPPPLHPTQSNLPHPIAHARTDPNSLAVKKKNPRLWE
jgi:hypothetical protein